MPPFASTKTSHHVSCPVALQRTREGISGPCCFFSFFSRATCGFGHTSAAICCRPCSLGFKGQGKPPFGSYRLLDSLGYTACIRSIEDSEDGRRVSFELGCPPPGAMCTDALTQPHHLVRMPRTFWPSKCGWGEFLKLAGSFLFCLGS